MYLHVHVCFVVVLIQSNLSAIVNYATEVGVGKIIAFTIHSNNTRPLSLLRIFFKAKTSSQNFIANIYILSFSGAVKEICIITKV